MILQSTFARHVRRSRYARPLGIAAYRFYMRLRPPIDGPKILVNSIPKAGTHLLMALLDATPGICYAGRHYGYSQFEGPDDSAQRRLGEIRLQLQKVRSSQYMTGHIRHDPDIAALLNRLSFRSLIVIRDPRDIAVSAAMYLETNKLHPMHRRFMEDYPTVDDRIRALVNGFPADHRSTSVLPLSEVLERFSGWLDEPHTCVVRFEDLVGPRGGGNAERQMAHFQRIFDFLELPARNVDIGLIARAAYTNRSVTFRRGQIGSWRSELTSLQRNFIEDSCGEQLVRFGYEL